MHRINRGFQCDSVLPEFGKPAGNKGWVRCNSRTFPGQSYYFNVNTRCTTWTRPVSKFIPTALLQPINLRSDEDYSDDAPMQVSDMEDDINDIDLQAIDQDLESKSALKKLLNEQEERGKKIIAEVLFKMYHCYDDDNTRMEIDDLPLNCDENSNDPKNASDGESSFLPENESSFLPENESSFLPEICYSSSSEDEFVMPRPRFDFNKNRQRRDSICSMSTIIVESEKDFNEIEKRFEIHGPSCNCNDLSRDYFDRLAILNFNEESCFSPSRVKIENVAETWNSSLDSLDLEEMLFGKISSSEDEDDEEDEEDEEEKVEESPYVKDGKFSMLRLKEIEYSDLMKAPTRFYVPKKKNKRKRNETIVIDDSIDKMVPNKTRKIICELNGVKTINYDYTPELPPGVSVSNLSDSGSSIYEAWNRENQRIPEMVGPKATKFENFVLPPNIREPDLSDSSSSSSTSTNGKGKPTENSTSGSDNDSDSSTESSSSSSSDSTSSNSNFYTIKRNPGDSKIVKKVESNESAIAREREKLIITFARMNDVKKDKSEFNNSLSSSAQLDESWKASEGDYEEED